MTALNRKDLYLLAFLFLVVLLIFYPLFYTEYIYTDEATRLWNYRPGSGSRTGVYLNPGVKNYVQQHYNPNITTIFFIRPAENAFRNKYKLQSSMDEFGVPSTFFSWVPEPLMRQLVYEKTGSREKAGQLTIKYWDNQEAFSASREQVTPGTLLVNVPEIMASGK